MAEQANADAESPDSDPTKTRVETWLKNKGVRLELKVAADFRRLVGDGHVDHARYYATEHEGQRKVREIDVIAKCDGLRGPNLDYVVTWFVVECKSSKKDPWMLYRADGSLASQFEGSGRRGLVEETLRVVERSTSVSLVDDQTIGEANYSVYATGQFAYQIADIGEDPGKDNSKQSAFQAVQQVLSAAEGAALDVPKNPGAALLSIFVPVVVTSAPLFTVDVKGGGYTVDRASIVPLIGRFTPTDELSLIWIVQEDALSEYVTAAVTGAHGLRLASSAPQS